MIEITGQEDPARPGWGTLRTEGLAATGRAELALGPVPECLAAPAALLLERTARALLEGAAPPPVPLEIDDPARWQLALARWALDSDSPGARRQAADLLAERDGLAALELLIDHCLTDPDAELRRHLACLLQGLDARRATEAMIEGLGNPSPAVARAAALVLEQHQDPDNLALLTGALRDPRAQVRRNLAAVLGRIYDPGAVEPLIERLADDEPEVRAAAAWSLGELADPRAVPALVAALADAAGEVRACAARSLAEIGDPAAEPALFPLLTDPLLVARRWGSLALQRLGGPASVAPLVAALGDPDGEVRQNAARGLGGLGDARAVPGLAGLLDDPDPEVQWTAVDALADLGDARAVDPMLALLAQTDTGETVVLAAIEALERLGAAPRLVEPLIGLLRHPVREAQSHAADALGRADPAVAVPLLLDHLGDRMLEPEQRVYAIPPLARLGDPRAVPALGSLLAEQPPEWLADLVRQALDELG